MNEQSTLIMDNLPQEVNLKILSYFSLTNLGFFAFTCKGNNNLLTSAINQHFLEDSLAPEEEKSIREIYSENPFIDKISHENILKYRSEKLKKIYQMYKKLGRYFYGPYHEYKNNFDKFYNVINYEVYYKFMRSEARGFLLSVDTNDLFNNFKLIVAMMKLRKTYDLTSSQQTFFLNCCLTEEGIKSILDSRPLPSESFFEEANIFFKIVRGSRYPSIVESSYDQLELYDRVFNIFTNLFSNDWRHCCNCSSFHFLLLAKKMVYQFDLSFNDLMLKYFKLSTEEAFLSYYKISRQELKNLNKWQQMLFAEFRYKRWTLDDKGLKKQDLFNDGNIITTERAYEYAYSRMRKLLDAGTLDAVQYAEILKNLQKCAIQAGVETLKEVEKKERSQCLTM